MLPINYAFRHNCKSKPLRHNNELMIRICKIVMCDLHFPWLFLSIRSLRGQLCTEVCSYIKIDLRCDVRRGWRGWRGGDGGGGGCNGGSIPGREKLHQGTLQNPHTTSTQRSFLLSHNGDLSSSHSASSVLFITKLDVIVTCNKDPDLCTSQTAPVTFSPSVQRVTDSMPREFHMQRRSAHL